MKILVTGGAGFIGSTAIKLAIKQGYSVVNIDSLTYASCLSNLKTVEENPNYKFEKVDIRNRKVLDQMFKKHNPDAVLHLAAESHVDRSIDNPVNFIETNVIGTYNMLEASRLHWIAQGSPTNFRFHHVSTDEVFGSLPENPEIKFLEETPYNPSSPYSASKASSDHLVRSWNKTYGLPVTLTNCSNNYGPYQFPEKLLPVIILNALAENSIPIYGDGRNVRDWLFVEDHAEALLLVLKEGRVGRSYNIGGNNELSNIDMAQTICNILDKLRPKEKGSYSNLITFVRDRSGHDVRYAINATRIADELGWIPRTPIDKGLETTVKWYLNNDGWWKALSDRNGFKIN